MSTNKTNANMNTPLLQDGVKQDKPSMSIESHDNVNVYYTADECYIYKQKGNSNGEPISNDSIIYYTVPNEVISISNQPRSDKYYVECILPVKGFVYLPDHNNINLVSGNTNNKMTTDPPQDTSEQKHDTQAMHSRATTFFQRDYTAQTFIKIDKIPAAKNNPEYNDEKPQETIITKILSSTAVKKAILFFRSHPFIPGLIAMIVAAVIEGLVMFDIYTDIIVTMQLKQSNNPLLFAISSALIAAPFVIAWSVASQTILNKYEKAHRLHVNSKSWSLFIFFYDIAPIGIIMILLFEIYHWFETIIIIPIYWLCTLGKRHRNISYQELGYYKLRKVSEVFAESLPQSVFQLCLLLGVFGAASCDQCNVGSVIQSLITSIIIATVWCTALYFEGRANGLSFAEYVSVTFQGSFDFVPYLPAIEKGVELKGEFVNWSAFKILTDSFGQISKAVYCISCELQLLKVSEYTTSALNRLSCRFLGSRLKILSIKNNLQIIVSRVESDLHNLFEKYDLDKSGSFDFIEFIKIFLSINSNNINERLIMNDIYSIWFKVADIKHTNEIWMLDLLLSANKSIEFLPLIDYELPLLHAYEANNICLITFLISANYHLLNIDNEIEFNICVIRAVMENNIQLACVLCENIGIPIVISIKYAKKLQIVINDNEYENNNNNINDNPYVIINLLGQEKTTHICRETNNPIWNENILFLIDFEVINDILQSFVTIDHESENSTSIGEIISSPDLSRHKSVKEVDEISLRLMANDSYQRTKQRRKQKQQQIEINTTVTSLVGIHENEEKINFNTLPKYLQNNINTKQNQNDPKSYFKRNESFSLNIGRKLRRKSSDFAHYILQKEQGFLIVTLSVYTKLNLDTHIKENKNIDDIDEKKEQYENVNEPKLSKLDSIREIDDKYIGKTYATINLKQNTSSYHKKIRIFDLNHTVVKGGNSTKCGNIACCLYLNVLQVYNDAVKQALQLKNDNKGIWRPMELIIDK